MQINSWPALVQGLILLTYWVRVIQLVRKTAKKAGHHANFIPEEKLGRFLRIVWIPLVGIWVFLPILYALTPIATLPLMGLLFSSQAVAWTALTVSIIGFIITWICWIKMGTSWRMGIDPNEKTQLVFTGPFAYVRNPIYGLSSVLMIMTALIIPTPIMIVIALLHVVLLQWEVRREESYLRSVHGAPYEAYLQNVGRFLPRSLRAYRP